MNLALHLDHSDRIKFTQCPHNGGGAGQDDRDRQGQSEQPGRRAEKIQGQTARRIKQALHSQQADAAQHCACDPGHTGNAGGFLQRASNQPQAAATDRIQDSEFITALGEEDGSSMPILGFTDNLKHSYRVLNLSFAYMFGMDVGLLRKGKSTKGAKIKTKNVGGKSSKPKNINTFKKRKN